eukprot:9298810-Karenia_brevis.AAC.1
MLHGLIGVAKRGRSQLDKGKAALRLVMHLGATKVCFSAIQGDMPILPTTGQWQSVFLPADCELRWSSSDL